MNIPKWQRSTFGQFMTDSTSTNESEFITELKSMSPDDRLATVKARVTDIISTLIGDDDWSENTPLMEAGLDSLSSVEFKNALQKEFSITLSSTILFDYPTMSKIVGFIGSKFISETPFCTEKDYSVTYDETSDYSKCRNLTISRKNVGWIKFLGIVDAIQLDINANISIVKDKTTVKGIFKDRPVVVFYDNYVPTESITSDLRQQLAHIYESLGGILLDLDEETGSVEFVMKSL